MMMMSLLTMFFGSLHIVFWLIVAGKAAISNAKESTLVHEETCASPETTEPFVLTELKKCDSNTDNDSTFCKGPDVPFRKEWIYLYDFVEPELHRLDMSRLPKNLSHPDFLRVYHLDTTDDDSKKNVSIPQLALAVRRIVESELFSDHPAILFRGLYHHISSLEAFQKFWAEVHGNWTVWEPREYIPIYSGRIKANGLDTTNDQYPIDNALFPHNENMYTPNLMNRFGLYCLHPAKEGGETMIVRNEDLTRSVRPYVQDMVREAGGVFYSKVYFDRSFDDDIESGMFWQEVCLTEDREECVEWFIRNGHNREDISFDEEGTMIVENVHPGFVKDRVTGRDLWFNRVRDWTAKRADDKDDFDWDAVVQTSLDEWEHVATLKLQRGDFLMLDNKRVQHGRLPFVQSGPGDPPRTIFVVYTK